MKGYLIFVFLGLLLFSCVSVVIQQTGRDNTDTTQEEENKETVIGEDNAR